MMITRRTFATLTFAVAALGLASAAYIGWEMHMATAKPLVLSQAAWKVRFEAPSELARGVDAVILATAISTRPGRVAFSDNGEDSLPFEEVSFEVERGMKGLKQGETAVVERAGGIDYEGHNVILDADGGPFEIGATYLLFLNRQEDGPFYYQVNDQGRYKLEADRLIAASEDDDSVAEFFNGRSLSDATGLLGEFLGKKPATPPGHEK